MSSIVVKYPLDPTGISPDNLVVGEIHRTVSALKRIIVPEHGPFYTESLRVYEAGTGRQLPPTDYVAVEYYAAASAKYGSDIRSVILITNSLVSTNDFKIDYQALGGDYSYSSGVIRELYEEVMKDDRPVNWPDILNKPDRYPAASHLHDVGDVFGFEYLTSALEALRHAILLGDTVSHDEIFTYIDNQGDKLQDNIDEVLRQLRLHERRVDNPHEVTKAQVGLGNLPNSKTDDRFTNSNNQLLTAKAMRDHNKSDDHDYRYILRSGEIPIEIRIRNNVAEIKVNNVWNQFWPPVWQ